MAVQIEEAAERLRQLLLAADDKALREYLATLQPADLAELVLPLSETRRRQVFEALDLDTAARTLESMEYGAQYEVITSLPRPLAAAILQRVSSDDLADLLGALNHVETEEILSLIPEDAQALRRLMQYPDETAGGLMSLEVVAVSSDHTVDQAIRHLRKIASEVETVYYVYVEDAKGRLVGVVSLRELVLAPPHRTVGSIANPNVVTVNVNADQHEVARLFEKYGFLALPVVDDDGVLLGIVTVDDVIDVIQEETTRDFARLGGQEPLEEPYLGARVLSLVKKRIGWLLLLFVAQSITGNILAHFEEALQAAIALAFFVPLLTGTAGNAGSQAATLLVRAMGMGEVGWQHIARVVLREAAVGFVLGIIMAGVGFFWASYFVGDVGIGLTVALTILTVITVASTIGAALPAIAARLRFDPAVASAPLVTTVTDASGLIIYFAIARWVLGL